MYKDRKESPFGRETRVKIPTGQDINRENAFAVCLKTDDDKSLVPTKVYKVKLVGRRIALIDEEGEPSVYPQEYFLVLSLSPIAENTLAEVIG